MMKMERRRSDDPTARRLVAALMTYLPKAWVSPSNDELIALYRLRYKMAVDERKFDCALVFLDKIIEVDPRNVEARLLKAEVYHRNLNDFSRAVDIYGKVIRLTAREDSLNLRARNSLAELMELVS